MDSVCGVGMIMKKNKIIGIVGGMGPLASCDLYEKIIINTKAQKDCEHIHILLDSNTDIPDRTKAILHHGESPVPYILKSAQELEKIGAEIIVLACNTSHYFLDDVRRGINVPVLSMIDACLEAVLNQGITKAALFATEGTVKSGIYQKTFNKNGIELIIPDERQQKIVTDVIYEGVKAYCKAYNSLEFQELVEEFEKEGAQTCLLACTELPVFVKDKGIWGKFIDSSLELAKLAIRESGANLR